MSQAITPQYSDFLGVDRVTPLISRGPRSAELLQNWAFLASGSLSSRPGWKYICDNSANIGYGFYVRTESQVEQKTRLMVGSLLYTQSVGSFLITYTGPATAVYATLLFAENKDQYQLDIIEDGVTVLSTPLGIGIDVVTPTTLADLKIVIDAISSGFYTATITGDTTVPAAFLPSFYREALLGTPKTLSIETRYASAVRKPTGASDNFTNTYTARNSSSHRNATFLNNSQVIYICTELDKPQKYDGRIAYNMGMAKATATVTPTGAGAITALWRYKVRYSHRDAKGNYIPGSLTDYLEANMVANTSANVAIPTLQTTSGYSTDYAKVNGNQGPATVITVDAAHTLQIGDKVRVFDRAVSTRVAVERTVLNRTNTTVTLDVNVTVLDNDIISQNLIIEIYRTKSRGARLYQVAELPNDPSGASITFVDTIADASLGAEFTEPRRQPDPPPVGGVITAHQGLPVITRMRTSPNNLAWAEPDNLEGFNEAEGRRNLFSRRGGEITGVWSNVAALEIFYETSIYRLYGTLYDGNIEFRAVSQAVGLPHQHCIDQLDSGQMVWLSNQGPRQMGPGGVPQRVGMAWDALLRTTRYNDARYILERSIVIDNPIEQICYFFLNCETTTGGAVHTNQYSEVWVLDYQADGYRWVGPWTNLNMSGGAIVDDGHLSWVERRYQEATTSVVGDVIEHQYRGDDFDYIDHNVAIPLVWKPSYEDKGEKFVKAIFEKVRFYSSDIQNQAGFSLIVGVEKNYSNVEVSNFVLQFGNGGSGSGWGFEDWGTFTWGNPVVEPVESRIPNTPDADNAANALRVTMSHETIYARPIISAFGLVIKTSYSYGTAVG